VHPEVLGAYPQIANDIKAIDEGRMSLGSIDYRKRALYANVLNRYDPEWDQNMFDARKRMNNDLTGNGNTGKMLMAINQLLPHLNTASQRAQELDNSNYPAANSIKNWIATATGDSRIKAFNGVREVAAMDAARLLRGSGQMSEKDIEFWRDNLASAGSPRQLQDSLHQLADDLIGARVSSIEHEYRMVMKKDPPQFVSNDARTALDAMKARKTAADTADKARTQIELNVKIPPRPASVPEGSHYSPSRNQFRGPDGTIYDINGKAQ
jgi:hypothetical protein